MTAAPGLVLKGIYASDIRRALKLTLNLLFITMARKAELTEASWDEFDLELAVWDIPAERIKKDKRHRAHLSRQAVAMLNGRGKAVAQRENLTVGNLFDAWLADGGRRSDTTLDCDAHSLPTSCRRSAPNLSAPSPNTTSVRC